MKLSIVSTLYNSELTIRNFHKEIGLIANEYAGNDYEIIFVNDGSPDNSLSVAIELTKKDKNLHLIDLSRNFGHHKAIMTGLMHAKGDLVYLLDSDLEEDPKCFKIFLKKLKRDKLDMVYGVQEKRRGSFLDKISGLIFYKLFRFLTDINQPNNILTIRLMTKKYVSSLILHQEREINVGGLFIINGFKQTYEVVSKKNKSQTSYTFLNKLSHLINAITSFSNKPLMIIFLLGTITFFSSILFLFYIFFLYIYKSPPDGYISIIASIWFFSGLLIFVLGLNGLYLAKIFSESKQRPYTIIKSIYKNGIEK